MLKPFDQQIIDLCNQGKKLDAVKFYKDATRSGLKESKEYVDKLCQENGIVSPIGKGGCFIATACYGDYDSLEVLLLRKFRDEKLLTTRMGKAFVNFYYQLSPYMAKRIEKSEFLKKNIRNYFLKPIIGRIEKNTI